MRLSGMAPEVNAPLQLEPLERTLARDAAMAERGAMRRDMMGRPGMRGMARRTPSRMKVPSPIRRPAVVEPYMGPVDTLPAFKKGGAVKGEKIAKVMREYKKGELHSGSKKGPKVTNPKQAMAIALSESRRMKKADGGEVFSDENLAYGNKKGPYRGSRKKGRELGRQDRMQRARDQRALDKARHAEKYAPGLSLDMPDEPMSRYEKGGSVKKFSMGGAIAGKGAREAAQRAAAARDAGAASAAGRGAQRGMPARNPRYGQSRTEPYEMPEGRVTVEEIGDFSGPRMRKGGSVKKAVHKHEKAMHPGKPLTKLSRGGVPSYGRKPMYGGGKC